MASDVVLMVAAKLALTMGIVVTASLMVERAGPFIGAMIATLPISAGRFSFWFMHGLHKIIDCW